MVRKIALFLSIIIIVSGMAVSADRNKTMLQQQSGETAVFKQPALSNEATSRLRGYMVAGAGNNFIFNNGEPQVLDKDETAKPELIDNVVYLPFELTAKAFQLTEKPVDEESVIYNENGIQLISADSFAAIFNIDIAYNQNGIIVYGKEQLKDENTIKELKRIYLNTYYVTNDATTKGDGSFEKPFGGLENAVQALREITSHGMWSDINVYLFGGEYYLDKTLVLTPEDSGKNGFKITYASYPGEKAELSAAKEITGWKPYKDGIYMVQLPRGTEYNVIYENGTFARKARHPNHSGIMRDSYLKVAKTDEIQPSRALGFGAGEIPYLNDRTGLQAYYFAGGNSGVYNFFMNLYDAQINFRTRRITMNGESTNSYALGKGSRYFLQGCLEFLDVEGEFHLDKNTYTLYYKPYNEDISKQKIKGSSLLTILQFQGTTSDKVKNIYFDNLKISGTGTSAQIIGDVSTSIIFNYAEHCGITNSEITNMGGTAIYARQECMYLNFSGNYIHHVGGNGIWLYGQTTDPAKVVCGYNTISNNYIKSAGLLQSHSSGILVTSSDFNTVTHNHITDVPRFGIAYNTGLTGNLRLGRVYNGVTVTEENMYDLNECRGNYIAFNDISNCMTDSQDGGPIYAWGAGKYNVIDNNYIHDSDIYFSIGYGIYIDDVSGYAIIKNNIINRLQQNGDGSLNSAIMLKSRDHNVYNNFFTNNNSVKSAISTETKIYDQQKDIAFLRNIVSNSGDNLHGQWTWMSDRFLKCDFNLYYNESGNYGIYNNPGAKNFDEWRKLQTDYGYMDTNSIHKQQVGFVDEENEDFRLRYDSPALRLGIQDIDTASIGVNESFMYSKPNQEIARLFLTTSTDGISANVRLKRGESSSISTFARTTEGFVADLSDAKITFESNNKDIATVDSDGNICAVSSGIAEITVTVTKDEVELKRQLFVLVDYDMDRLEITALNNVLDNGDTTEVTALAMSQEGLVIPVSEITFKSSNPNVAEIDSEGTVITKSPGTATMTATAEHDGVKKTAEISIVVLDGILDTVTLTAEKFDGLIPGETVQLDFDVQMTNKSYVDAKELPKKFEVADEAVATVDENGKLTALAGGRTKVYVTLSKDGISKTGDLDIVVYEKAEGNLLSGWNVVNFGNSHGYADFDNDKVKILCTGWDYWGRADDGFYLYKNITGGSKLTATAEVDSLLNTNTNAATGIMIRETAEADSKHVVMRVRPTGEILAVWRSEKGGTCGYQAITQRSFPVSMRIEKDGSNINLLYHDGNSWVLGHSIQMEFSDNYTAGVAVFAQSQLSTETVLNKLDVVEY